MNPGYHANKYQMNLVLRLVSVCIKFPEKCNQNVIVKDGHGVYKAVNKPPPFFQLGHIQGTETANPVCHILTGQHGVFHFLLDDLQLYIRFPVLQLVKPLFGGRRL